MVLCFLVKGFNKPGFLAQRFSLTEGYYEYIFKMNHRWAKVHGKKEVQEKNRFPTPGGVL